MIDWLTVLLDVDHSPVDGGRVMSLDKDGFIEWQAVKKESVRGTWETNIQLSTTEISSNGRGATLRLDGNLLKWLQGHNIIGTDSVLDLVNETVNRLWNYFPELDLRPDAQQLENIQAGHYRVLRIDVAHMYDVGSPRAVLAWIRQAALTAHVKFKGGGMLKGDTLYFGKHSRRSSIKCYHKGTELKAKGHEIDPFLADPRLLEIANNSIRFECVYRAMELKRLGLAVASALSESVTLGLFNKLLGRLQVSDNLMLNDDKVNAMKTGLRCAYLSWLHGEDLRGQLPKNTFYRYRRQLLEFGIDIAQVRRVESSGNNVVPLVTKINPVPLAIPQWAINDGLVYVSKQRERPRLAIVK